MIEKMFKDEENQSLSPQDLEIKVEDIEPKPKVGLIFD